MQNCGITQKLFSKSVPVTIKDGLNQCRKSSLFLTVEWKEASAAMRRQELLISLTDGNDPFFLYHLHLSEEDFQILKSSQGLLVDFNAFPQKFIDLIEICLSEEDKASPKFLLILNGNEHSGNISPTSQLDVVETNPFKHLIHLTLKFIAATDSSVKQYLATTLKKLKDEKHQLESRLSYLEQDSRSRLSSFQGSLEQKSQEVEKLKNELSVQRTLLEANHARELQEERRKLLDRQQEIELKLENGKKEKEHYFDKEMRQLEKRISCLDVLNKELKDQNHKKDIHIQELKSSISSFEGSTQQNHRALREYQEKNIDLESELKQKISEIANQKSRFNELDNHCTYLKDMLNKLQIQYEKNHEHEKIIELEYSDLKEIHRNCKSLITKHENTIKENNMKIRECEMTIKKGNEIIKKYQLQIDDQSKKLKSKDTCVFKLQNNIASKDMAMQELNNEIAELERLLEKKNSELRRKTEDWEIDSKAKDNVINDLNRALVEKGLLDHYDLADEELPLIERRLSGGDVEVLTANNKNPTNITARNRSTQYNASCPSNPKSSYGFNKTPPDFDYNAGDFELDAAALSAAFTSGDNLKHSTGKKSSSSRTAKTFKERVNR